MGDLPGSPSVAPSPPFCMALRGEGGKSAEPRLSQVVGRGGVAGIQRLARGAGSVVSTRVYWDG
jgi:hypothetical protein